MSKRIKENAGEITLQTAVISHIGCVRGNNEDNFYFDGDWMKPQEVNQGTMFHTVSVRDHHLLGICDGMGGLEGGERASGLVAERLKMLDSLMPIQELPSKIDEFALKANEAVQEDAGKQGQKGKEGTTLVLAYLTGLTMHVANVGDSRLYSMRNGRLMQASMDHSEVFQEMLAGKLTMEEARTHSNANKIEHWLGMAPERISKDFVFHRSCSLCNGDRLMLCSDGLSDLLPQTQIEEIMATNASVMDAAKLLIQNALEMSGKDNVTVIVADVSGPHLPMITPAAMAELTMTHELTETVNTTMS